MTHGIIITHAHPDRKTLELAGLFAKLSQSDHCPVVAVVPDRYRVNERIEYIFDEVINVDRSNRPVNMKLPAYSTYNYSPFDETFVVESGTLMCTDISNWWPEFKFAGMLTSVGAKNFFGHDIVDPDAENFFKNNIAHPFTNLCYYSKSDQSKDIFELSAEIGANWYEFKRDHVRTDIGMDISRRVDIILAKAAALTGNSEYLNNQPLLYHVLPELKYTEADPSKSWMANMKWNEHLQTYVSGIGAITLSNNRMQYPLTYEYSEGLLNDTVMDVLVEALEKRNADNG